MYFSTYSTQVSNLTASQDGKVHRKFHWGNLGICMLIQKSKKNNLTLGPFWSFWILKKNCFKKYTLENWPQNEFLDIWSCGFLNQFKKKEILKILFWIPLILSFLCFMRRISSITCCFCLSVPTVSLFLYVLTIYYQEFLNFIENVRIVSLLIAIIASLT